MMFTFRKDKEEPFHPHRLLYLHASKQDKKNVESSRKFKTEPNQDVNNHRDGSKYQFQKAQLSKNKQSQSMNKIQYFDLDLKHLISTTSSTRSRGNENCLDKGQQSNRLKDVSNQRGYLNSSRSRHILPDSSRSKGYEINQTFSIEHLMQKQNLQELWRPTNFNETNNNKNKARNNDIKTKYIKLKQNSQRPPPKTILTSNSSRVNKERLQVRKLEKTLVDPQGNQYKVTIERLRPQQ